MTAHWNQKDHWLGVKGGWHSKCEIWDGQRFGELSWFWDPNARWVLPCYCPSCNVVISLSNRSLQTTNVEVECSVCHSVFNHKPTFTNGDPRNIALIGHWDGWQPFATSGRHSCGKEII